MSSFNQQDWEQKLKELEIEIEQNISNTQASPPESVKPKVEINQEQPTTDWLNAAKDWFNRLPSIGKLVVSIGAVLVGLSVLNTFLRLISSLITIAVLGGLLYLGYKFLIATDD